MENSSGGIGPYLGFSQEFSVGGLRRLRRRRLSGLRPHGGDQIDEQPERNHRRQNDRHGPYAAVIRLVAAVVLSVLLDIAVTMVTLRIQL